MLMATSKLHLRSKTVALSLRSFARKPQFGKFDIREIFSVAHVSDGPLDANLANALLIYNAHLKLGSWRVHRRDDDTCVVAFAVQIAANTDAKSLLTALSAVVETADEVESKLDEEDKF